MQLIGFRRPERVVSSLEGRELSKQRQLPRAPECPLWVESRPNPPMSAMGGKRTLLRAMIAQTSLRIIPSEVATFMPSFLIVLTERADLPSGRGVTHCSTERLPFILKRKR